MAYQSFLERKGSSLSFDKLKALKIPKGLKNKNFLDIGCNEGFFCIEAYNRGAKNVYGIDKNAINIQNAKQWAKKYFNEDSLDRMTFLCERWDNVDEILKDVKFDVIIYTSCLHYEIKHKGIPTLFFNRVHNILKKNGTFIIECCIIDNDEAVTTKHMVKDIEFHHPSESMLKEWLDNFEVECVGDSIKQSGDESIRRVFHCKKK